MLKQQVYREGGTDVETVFLKMMLHDIIASREDSEFGKVRIVAAALKGFPCGTIVNVNNSVSDDYSVDKNSIGGEENHLIKNNKQRKDKNLWCNNDVGSKVKYRYNIIDFIRTAAQECGISGYNEKKHAGDLRHVVIRTSAYNNKSLVILVVNSTRVFDKLKKLASKIYNELDNIIGVGVNFNPQKTNLILGKSIIVEEGALPNGLNIVSIFTPNK